VTRGTTWILTITAFVTAGWVVGQLLDAVLWHISWDYVYRPEQFTEGGVRWGAWLGTVAAATATVGTPPHAKHWSVVVAFLMAALATLIGAALTAGTGAAMVKLDLIQPANNTLIPTARIWFCEGLWRGAAAGALLGTVSGSWTLWKGRKRRSEVGSRKSEVGGRKSEVGGRKSEVGGRKSEVGSRRSEVGSSGVLE
jgi:hypothetical protein